MVDVHAQRLPPARAPEVATEPEILGAYLEDASAAAPGSAAGLVRPTSEAEAATFLRDSGTRPVLFQGARSSLTGGAVPQGEIVVSLERMCDRGPVEERAPGRVTVQPGMRLADLQASLANEGYYFPPVPTYQLATIGGAASTNAGGAASFKYGVTRDWVHGLRVLLFNGELLVLERGQYVARRGDAFRIVLSDGRELVVPVPDYRLPPLKKISAGYHSADPLDLVDLFVGAEGTLGLITALTLNLTKLPPAVLTGLALVDDARLAQLLAAALRDAALRARERGDRLGPDVRSIEWLDENCLELLREHDEGRKRRIDIPPTARAALLFELELPERVRDEDVAQLLMEFLEHRTVPDGPLTRLFRLLEDHRALDTLELAFPNDDRRRQALGELREAVPQRVQEILGRRREAEPGVHKVGGDMIVPFAELGGMIEAYRQGFTRRGLAFAIWGHLSDGNLHANAIPRNAAETRAGIDALMEFANEAIRRGGAPLSEHGVGRSPVKQELLRRFLGDGARATMRGIKRAIDPPGRFAPGVLFPS